MTDLTVNSEHIATIDGYTSGGLGVCRVGGRAVFVEGALRGETCRIRISKVTRNAVFAVLLGVDAKSPNRIKPACERFGECGGCDFLHMDYAEELEQKRTRVEDALRRIGGIDITVPPVVGSDTQHAYRNKAVYIIGESNGQPAYGFYGKGSHDFVPTAACLIQSDVSHRAAAAVTEWMRRYGVAAHSVRRVFCRIAAANGKAQIALVTAGGLPANIDELVSGILASCPEAASIVANVNNTRGGDLFSGKFQTLWGEDSVTEELCGIRLKLSPGTFCQVNSAQAERLYETVVKLAGLKKTDTVLDLFCGAGAMTLLLARGSSHAIGAEISPEAVRDAKENARINGISNAEFICADASEAAQALKNSGIAPDVVVVDPPRRGLQTETIGAIADLSPERIVYVSCDPATLARDLKELAKAGFAPVSAAPFDMFPRCAHIECCCLLS